MRAPLLLVPALLLAACGGEEAPRDKYVSPDKPGLSDSARAAVNALPDTARVYFNMANRHCDTVPPPEFKPRGDEDPAKVGQVVWEGSEARLILASKDAAYAGKPVLATVYAPDNGRDTATAELPRAGEVALSYPRDFGPDAPAGHGVYTVVWSVDGHRVACDGFKIVARNRQEGGPIR